MANLTPLQADTLAQEMELKSYTASKEIVTHLPEFKVKRERIFLNQNTLCVRDGKVQ